MKTIYSITFLLLCGVLPSQTSYTWTGKPIFDIEAKSNGQSMGIIRIELFPRIAPKHTRSFDSLVSVKFYDTIAFHRVVPGFVIQGGDPNSRHGPASTWGFGDPSQPTVQAEFSPAKHLRGTFSAARKANDTNSYTSQFFICVGAQPSLNGKYTVFGRVLAGMSVVDAIVGVPRNSNDQPLQKIEMFVTRNGSNDTVPQAPVVTAPLNGTNFEPWPSVVQLKYTAVKDAQLYELQVAHDSTFSMPVVDARLNTLLYNYYSPVLYASTYWRVRSNNGGHFSPWSTAMFSTYNTTGTLDGKPGAMLVMPNPSAGTFSFVNAKAGQLLEIFDALGKKVYSGITGTGPHRVDLGQQPAGHYMYRITSATGESGRGVLVRE